MGLRQCQVCEEAQFKYKCPTCLIPYNVSPMESSLTKRGHAVTAEVLRGLLSISATLGCSLACFKKHKEVPCSKPLSSKTVPSPVESILTPKRLYQEVEEHSWVLQKQQLESIAISKEIQDALKDDELRGLIYKIDSCTNPMEELDKAMEGPIFREFTDKILSIVSPHD